MAQISALRYSSLNDVTKVDIFRSFIVEPTKYIGIVETAEQHFIKQKSVRKYVVRTYSPVSDQLFNLRFPSRWNLQSTSYSLDLGSGHHLLENLGLHYFACVETSRTPGTSLLDTM